MNADNWLSRVRMIGEYPQPEIDAFMDAIGEVQEEGSDDLETGRGIAEAVFDFMGGSAQKPWLATGHTYGYIPAGAASASVKIRPAFGVTSDAGLAGARVRVTLDAVHAHAYPGRGPRTVLVHMIAQSGTGNGAAAAEFSRRFTVGERDNAAVSGLPVFDGLRVDAAGILLTCAAVNVGNQDDEELLRLLDGDAFKAGLDLAAVAGPALAIVTTFAAGITKAVLRSRRNVVVQRFDLGLDLGSIAARMKLVEGSYIALQLPREGQAGWDWSRWNYDPATARIVARDATRRTLDLNYLVFSVSRCGDDHRQRASLDTGPRRAS